MKKNLAIYDLLLQDTELAIKWNDDEQSFISLKVLRDHCPCAFCSGEKDVLGNIYKGPAPVLNDSSFQINGIQPVGYYGLQLYWKDGHNTGIFTGNLLKTLSS